MQVLRILPEPPPHTSEDEALQYWLTTYLVIFEDAEA